MFGLLPCGVAPGESWSLAVTAVDRNLRSIASELWAFLSSPLICWPALVLLAAVAGAVVIEVFRARRQVGVGLCPGCGYDLRASPDYCPECGRPRAKARRARVAGTLNLDAGGERLTLPILDEYRNVMEFLRRQFPRQHALLFGFDGRNRDPDASSEEISAAVQHVVEECGRQRSPVCADERFCTLLRRIRQFARKHAFARVRRSFSGPHASSLYAGYDSASR